MREESRAEQKDNEHEQRQPTETIVSRRRSEARQCARRQRPRDADFGEQQGECAQLAEEGDEQRQREKHGGQPKRRLTLSPGDSGQQVRPGAHRRSGDENTGDEDEIKRDVPAPFARQ